MRLISKKTPFIIAGGETLRRKIVAARDAAAKRRRRKKILTITGIGALGAGIAVLAKKRRGAEQFPPIVEPRGEVSPEEIVDLRQEKQEPQADTKQESKAKETKSTKKS